MIYNTIIIRFGELTTKGKNRKDFINKLATSIDKALFEYKGTYSLDVRHDHIYINILDYDKFSYEPLKEVSGINSFSLALKREIFDLDEIIEKEEEDKFTNNIPYDLSSEDWLKREDEITSLMHEELLSILHKRGLTDATIEDVKKQMEYDEHKYDEWHKCYIKEVELY